MPDHNLPEGTDHIIAGAGTGPDEEDLLGAASDQRIGEETMWTPDEDPADDRRPAGGEKSTGGAATGGAGVGDNATGGKPGAGSTNGNLFESLGNWQTVGTDRAREYAQVGLERATAGLDEVVKMIHDAADQIDDKVGEQYGLYARRAADSLGGFGDTFRNKDVDELFTDARELVKKSPAVAIGAAAAIGFMFARLARAGIDGATVAADAVTKDGSPTGDKA